ncbi:unnamed protein product [Chrysodeixis includens]|uniref:Peroxidase n=1 Tax=Chrysodeixis includens TaxID=689277 RepID=A0A9P0C1W3_CHRIL|nr:unnamed protein product [Chrysodeixis includens]
MPLKRIAVVCLLVNLALGLRYDYHSSKPVTESLLAYYDSLNATDTCTLEVAPCDPNEWRRLDGSCNNLKQPAKGTYFVPMIRLMEPHYHNGNEARKAANGEDLTLPRRVRTTLLKVGKSSHPELSQQVPSFGGYLLMDTISIHDTENMVLQTTTCCEPEHMNDPGCAPNIIPEDDPVHRFSGIRCMNMTRPLTYQDFHCTKQKVPSPIIRATPAFDGSTVYSQYNDGENARSYEGGLLISEEENGKFYPPNGPRGVCPLNVPPKETRCYQNQVNSVLSHHVYMVWFYRNHNYIAKELAKVNPHWDDETLYQTARDINIAIQQNMQLYEWLSSLMGHDNLVKAGILTKDKGFRDVYDENSYPVMTLDYVFALRWFHTMLETTAHLYDKDGNKVGDMPFFNPLFRTGWLPVDRNEEYATNGFIRQPCHNPDHSIDFDQIYNLKLVYKDVRDIDLIAGMWSERHMKGGRISKTLGDIMVDAFGRAMRGDRYWFERKNRPHACTKAQLKEVRKYTLARLICNVGEGVTHVTKRGFYNVGPKNPLVLCNDIPQIKFSVWKEKI